MKEKSSKKSHERKKTLFLFTPLTRKGTSTNCREKQIKYIVFILSNFVFEKHFFVKKHKCNGHKISKIIATICLRHVFWLATFSARDYFCLR